MNFENTIIEGVRQKARQGSTDFHEGKDADLFCLICGKNFGNSNGAKGMLALHMKYKHS